MFEPQTETTIDSIELNLGRRSLEENLNNKKIQFWPKWSILQINGGCLLVLGPRRAKVTIWRSRLYQLSNHGSFLHCILLEIISFARQMVKLSKREADTTALQPAPQLAHTAPSGHKVTTQKQLILIFIFLNKINLTL